MVFFIAVEIESEDDDCDSDVIPPTIGKVYATIDSFPPAPYLGEWVIGGVAYSATTVTEFEEEHGPFAIDACVEAEYRATSGGNMLLEVETEHAYKCQNDDGDDEFTAYGVIELLPDTPGLTGTWQVSGLTYEVSTQTELEEEHGFFELGAFVEVKYIVSGTLRLANEIETHVAPNHGMYDRIGILMDFDANDKWGDWLIDGITYKADPVIEVADGDGAPQLGQPVVFNTYEYAGVQYMTAVALSQNTIFLPMMIR